MFELAAKGLISGAIVVAASEVSRRSSVWAAVLVSLPLTSMLAILWLYRDTHDVEQVANFSWAVLWVVLPSVVFFIALPLMLLKLHWPFWPSIIAATAVMVIAYAGYVRLLAALGVEA